MNVEDFVKRLHETYGSISFDEIRRHNSVPTETVVEPLNELEILTNPFDYPEPSAQKIIQPKKICSTPSHISPRQSFVSSQSPIKTSSTFSPVSIASTIDWIKLRAEVLDLHELKTFLAGKMDSQSPHFSNIIESYCNSAEKALAQPQEINEDSSTNFVDKLSEVIKKRFFTILKSCQKGIQGKGEQPQSYYRELERRVQKYFSRIGLKSDNIKPRSDFRFCQERMNALPTPAPSPLYNNKINEVFVQPHYFEYHDDAGDVQKRWIDGECTVYKL